MHITTQNPVTKYLPLALAAPVLRVEQIAHKHIAALHVE